MIDDDGREPIAIALLCMVGLASCAVSFLVVSAQFQRDLPKICRSLYNSVAEGFRALGGAMKRAATTLASKIKSITKNILNSFARAKTIAKYRTPTEIHHVVAQKAPNASYAREILKKVGIGYNSAINTIPLKTGLHRRLHTNEYYGWANSVVISAYNSANGNSALQYLNVIAALGTIRTFLSKLNEIVPY